MSSQKRTRNDSTGDDSPPRPSTGKGNEKAKRAKKSGEDADGSLALMAGDAVFLVIQGQIEDEDAEVIGVFMTFDRARTAAIKYLLKTYGDIGPDLVGVDWRGGGFCKYALLRVWIERRRLDRVIS
jgi:hypothetical protein